MPQDEFNKQALTAIDAARYQKLKGLVKRQGGAFLDRLGEDDFDAAVDALSEAHQPHTVLPEGNRQRQLDISNLRFFAEMFEQHRWSTVATSWEVFEQTLREIADRIEGVQPRIKSQRFWL